MVWTSNKNYSSEEEQKDKQTKLEKAIMQVLESKKKEKPIWLVL